MLIRYLQKLTTYIFDGLEGGKDLLLFVSLEF